MVEGGEIPLSSYLLIKKKLKEKMIDTLVGKALNYFSENPITGFSTWLIGWIGSYLPELKCTPFYKGDLLNVIQLKEDLLWHFQILSLLIGSIAGILTIVSLITKQLDRRRALKRRHENHKP